MASCVEQMFYLDFSLKRRHASPFPTTGLGAGDPIHFLFPSWEKFQDQCYSICPPRFQDDCRVCYLPVMSMHLAWFWVVKEVQIKKNPTTLSSILVLDHSLTAGAQLSPLSLQSEPSAHATAAAPGQGPDPSYLLRANFPAHNRNSVGLLKTATLEALQKQNNC